MAPNKGKRPVRHLSATEKISAIQRIHDGESKASVARDIGVPESTLRGWCKNEDKLRTMSRQLPPIDSKTGLEQLTEKMSEDLAAVAASGLLGNGRGPPEKRQKLNHYGNSCNSKVKFENINFDSSRNALSAIDPMTSLGYNGLSQNDFNAFKANNDFQSPVSKTSKSYGNGYKNYNNDAAKNDLSMNAINTLTNFSHLTGLPQSTFGMGFNEIAANLTLAAHLHLNSLSGLVSNGSSTSNVNNNLRNVRQRSSSNSSPRTGADGERGQILTVKHLSKLQQKSTDVNAMDLVDKQKKIPVNPNEFPSDDSCYWLQQQQSAGNLYSLPTGSSPKRASPVNSCTNSRNSNNYNVNNSFQASPSTSGLLLRSTPPLNSFPPQTTSTTPPGLTDDSKFAQAFQWYKSLGIFFNNSSIQLAANQAAAAVLAASNGTGMNSERPTCTVTSATIKKEKVPTYENILYSQLTKDTPTLTPSNSTDPSDPSNKPEDLSQAKPNVNGYEQAHNMSSTTTNANSASVIIKSESNESSPEVLRTQDTPSPLDVAECKVSILTDTNSNVLKILDKMLFNVADGKSKNINEEGMNGDTAASSLESSDGSDSVNDFNEAIRHGVLFLKWLESCSNPSITAMQVMQFRTLINCLKEGAIRANQSPARENGNGDSSQREERPRSRKRK